MPKDFATPDAKPLVMQAMDGRESDQLEYFLSPDQSEKVYCTTDEREAFEQDAEIALDQDVIEDQSDYDSLVRYLSEQCGLEEA